MKLLRTILPVVIMMSFAFAVSSCGDIRNYEYTGHFYYDHSGAGSAVHLKCSFAPSNARLYSEKFDSIYVYQLDENNNPIQGCGGESLIYLRSDKFFNVKEFTITLKDNKGGIHEYIINNGGYKSGQVFLWGDDKQTKESAFFGFYKGKKNPNVSFKK